MSEISYTKDSAHEIALKLPASIQEDENEIPKKPIITTDYQKARIEKRIEFYQATFDKTRNFKPKGTNPVFDALSEFIGGDPLKLVNSLEKIINLSRDLKACKLVKIKNNPQEVSISTSVTIEDLTYKETRTINIVGEGPSYQDRAEIPYSSHLARKLLGAKVGETRKFISEERSIEYKILAISSYPPGE